MHVKDRSGQKKIKACRRAATICDKSLSDLRQIKAEWAAASKIDGRDASPERCPHVAISLRRRHRL
jgi:hypothetical protein